MKKQILTICLMLLCLSSFAQTTIKGVVTSATDNEPLIGATVFVKGTAMGVITDYDGNYTIDNVESNMELTFSMLGYTTQKIKVGSQKVINVKLAESTIGLDDVVVIGYGTDRKSVV